MRHREWSATAGEAMLRRSLKRRRVSQAELARRLDVTRQTVHEWLTGVRRPSAERRRELLELLGVPFVSWDRVASWKPSDEDDEDEW